MKKEKILFIVFQFPPKTGPGVFRSLNFVKYLDDFNYEPVIATITNENINNLYGHMDLGLLEDLPEGIDIHRINHKLETRFYQILKKIRLGRLIWFFNYFNFMDHASAWNNEAFKEISNLIKDQNIKLIYTSSGPFSVWNLAKKIQRKFSVKWVADIRDPFSDGYMWIFPSKFHWILVKKWERKMLEAADHVIVNTPEVKKLYVSKGIKEDDKLTVITNGY